MFEFGVDSHGNVNGLTGQNDSALLKSMQTAAESHEAYTGRLMNDQTKTPTARKLMAAQHANRLLTSLAGKFNSISDGLNAEIQGHERKVDSEMAMNSTTRIMLAQGALAALGSASFVEVMGYLIAEDAEVTRAMSLPQAQVKYELSKNSGRQATIQSTAERVFLDQKELSGLRTCRKKLESGAWLQGYFSEQFAANQGTINAISASIVEA